MSFHCAADSQPQQRRSARRPMLQHARPLPDGQLDARPMLDGRDKDFSRLVEAVASVQQRIDTHAVPAPRFDFVEVAVVCIEWVVGLLVCPVAQRRRLHLLNEP
jgi:hypothetical protein